MKRYTLPGRTAQAKCLNCLGKDLYKSFILRYLLPAKGSFKLNQEGCTETEWKKLATKIWSMANDWEALLIPQRISNS